MTAKTYWVGSQGPFYYDPDEEVPDLDPADLRTTYGGVGTPLQAALVSSGTIKAMAAPVDDEDVLRLDDVGTSVGDVFGPASSTDEAVVLWDGASGKLLKDSGVTAFGELLGDGTRGRVLRQLRLRITDGTNASTVGCQLVSYWNGDSDGPTDNVAKSATTGNFTLNAAGSVLTIEAAGLSGNCLMALGLLSYNATGTGFTVEAYASGNDIKLEFYDFSGVARDITSLADSGNFNVMLLYLTDS